MMQIASWAFILIVSERAFIRNWHQRDATIVELHEKLN